MAHQVVGIGVVGQLADQVFQRAPCRLQLAAAELGARNAQPRPRDGLGGDDGFVQAARVVIALEPEQQLGADARRVEPVFALGLEAGQTEVGRGFEVLVFDRLEDVPEHAFAQAGTCQPLGEVGAGVGLDQVGIQRSFGRFGHLGIGGLAGDHAEDRGIGQQPLAPQLVEQVLTRGVADIEVVIAQHDVEGLMLQHHARVLHAGRLAHGTHTKVAQLGRHQAARIGVAVDDQRRRVLNGVVHQKHDQPPGRARRRAMSVAVDEAITYGLSA
mmetsp:Transcript_15044/g.35600  ORF Transcript_15044/g.35600 Transcript_15044/m.35600 type:complete len:271 (-) Transcript_15044:580-1392(-)